MWQFISANATALTLFVLVATLVVWAVYGQLLAKGLSRPRKPQLFIKQSNGQTPQSVCLLANMSQEAAYLRSVFIDLHTAQGDYRGTVNAYQRAEDHDAADNDLRTGVLGPLPGSSHIKLGRFDELLESSAFDAGLTASQDAPISTIGLKSFSITVVANYGPYEKLIGAIRRFDLDTAGNEIHPTMADTEQLKGWRHTRRLKGYLRGVMGSDH
jgi:hypothetical protein